MKIFDFVKSSRKYFSIKKYIKPSHTEEYFNNLHYNHIKNKKKLRSSTSDQAIFAMDRPLYPDYNKSLNLYDEQNEHYMYKFHRRVKELEERTTKHIEYAKATLEAKNSKKAFFTKKMKAYELGGQEEVAVDKETGLVYGLGFDEHITAASANVNINLTHPTQTIQKSETNLEELVNKLGYLDFRDFVALNKYIIEANSHEDLINQTKSRFLNMAIEKMTQRKKEEVRKSFKKLDETNKDLKVKERNDLKIEYLFENIDESKDLFYNYYYKLKELNSREESTTLNEFEKYEKMVQTLNKKTKIDKDDYYHKTNSTSDNSDKKIQYDLNDYMERIIKTYRDQRTTEIHQDSSALLSKYRALCEKWSKSGKYDYSFLWERAVTMAKYQTFLCKYKKMYVPTNIETERLINNYLREKRIKEFTKEKIMQEEDPYFSPLTDEEEIYNSNSEKIFDEDSKQLAIEKHEIKQKYFDAKYEFKLKELKENIDKQLADELGLILTQESETKLPEEAGEFEEIMLNNPNRKTPKYEFIENFVNEHYKNFKLDYMYNYMDFFSNKYIVRRKIAEEMKRKVSLKEINFILNNIVSKKTGSEDLNKKTFKYSISDFIMSEYGKIRPNFIDTVTEGSTGNVRTDEERRNAVLSAMNNADSKNLELDESDKFEVELYKGIKNDPYFKHYLYNNFAYFAETMNDFVSGYPYINKGFKNDDKIKYEQLKKVSEKKLTDLELSRSISENKSEVLDSLQNNIKIESNNPSELSSLNEPTQTANLKFFGKGKRKRSRAYAELTPGNGTITVNGREFYNYFTFSPNRAKVLLPLQTTDTICNWDVKLTIQGGGSSGQAEAAIPAISKALIKINPEWRKTLAKAFLLKHDPRNVEPKKPGKIKARKSYVYNRR